MSPTGTGPIVLCVDGSENSLEAVAAGFALLPPHSQVVVATVVEARDHSLVTGGGHAGGVMSVEELDEHDSSLEAEGRSVGERAAADLGIPDPEVLVLRGEPGRALCAFATDRDARALVIGSRGRGGITRALLGSVSDYVVRNAPCPVVITSVPG